MADRYRGYGDPAGCGVDRGRSLPFNKRLHVDTRSDTALFRSFVGRACDLGDKQACLVLSHDKAQPPPSSRFAEIDLLRVRLERSGLAEWQRIARPAMFFELRRHRDDCLADEHGFHPCWGDELALRVTGVIDAKGPTPEVIRQIDEACATTLECNRILRMAEREGADEEALRPRREKAVDVLVAACEEGSCTCGQATKLMGEDDPRYVDAAKLGCSAGEAEACFALGRLYEDGRLGLPRDPVTALSLYRVACPEQLPVEGFGSALRGEYSPRACARLAALYRDGELVAKDKPRANFFQEAACDTGYAVIDLGCVDLESPK
ncbi:MAG: hypothetical protein U0271_14925 [Polyangiaceae bacterium]